MQNGNAMNSENWNKLWLCTFQWWWQSQSKQRKKNLTKQSENENKIENSDGNGSGGSDSMERKNTQREREFNPSLVWDLMYCCIHICSCYIIWIDIMDTSFEHAECVCACARIFQFRSAEQCPSSIQGTPFCSCNGFSPSHPSLGIIKHQAIEQIRMESNHNKERKQCKNWLKV